jgi:hypothetical protein
VKCHDPRISNDRTDKVETANTALVLAERLIANGYDPAAIDWDRVALQADRCDQPLDTKTRQPVFPDLPDFLKGG